MKLYGYFQSSASYRVRLALGLKGLKAEMAFVNLVEGEQHAPAYEAINPQALVPTFIDKGQILTQSLAILEYLEEAYPAPALLPKDPFTRAYVRSLALLIACETAPLGNLKIRKHLFKAMAQPKEAVDAWMLHWIREGLSAFERMLAHESYAGDFCAGNTPGMADCCLMPQLFNAQRWGCDLGDFPHILRIHAACERHPAFLAAHPSRQPDAV